MFNFSDLQVNATQDCNKNTMRQDRNYASVLNVRILTHKLREKLSQLCNRHTGEIILIMSLNVTGSSSSSSAIPTEYTSSMSSSTSPHYFSSSTTEKPFTSSLKYKSSESESPTTTMFPFSSTFSTTTSVFS